MALLNRELHARNDEDDAMHKSGLCHYAVSVCLSVCLCVSVTFVDHVKTNKDIFKIFSPSGRLVATLF